MTDSSDDEVSGYLPPSDSRLDNLEAVVKKQASDIRKLAKVAKEQSDFQTTIFNDFMNRLDALETRQLTAEVEIRSEIRERTILSEEISTIADIIHEVDSRLNALEEYLE